MSSHRSRIEVVQGDITAVESDAIVNAANETLLGGGGVDGAIHAAAGPKLLEACKDLPLVAPHVRCPTGEARITPGFRLAAGFVIHTVGPVWNGGRSGEPGLLADCYRNSVALAREYGVRSLAFPAISCGAFGYPVADACRIAVHAIDKALQCDSKLETVLLVAFDSRIAEAFSHALSSIDRSGSNSA